MVEVEMLQNGILSGDNVTNGESMAQLTINGDSHNQNSEWLADNEKLEAVKTLKELVYGNCRLLYGSERFKFYDIVICEDEPSKTFAALLTVQQNTHVKIIRKDVNPCPVEALRCMVQNLQRDTGILLNKYPVGAQVKGQQGYTNNKTGKFELLDIRKDERLQGPDDDTSGLMSRYSEICHAITKRKWVEDGPCKRPRMDTMNGRHDYLDYDD